MKTYEQNCFQTRERERTESFLLNRFSMVFAFFLAPILIVAFCL
jgi:hypothetical protein